jgi:hypothetical protein
MSARRRLLVPTTGLLVAGLLVAGCGSDGSTSSGTGDGPASSSAGGTTLGQPVIDPGDGGDYRPVLDPGDFVSVIDNPYLPWTVGSTWTYEGETADGTERTVVTVTDQTKEIIGIPATVVRDSVSLDGELIEDTYDWYAQDKEGNVWYLGEDSTEYENGKPAGTQGSWEAGVDGALPGIVMPATPTVGDAYRQEYLAGEAEDLAEVIAVGQSATVPAGSYEDVAVMREWNPLEPDVVEEKSYAPGVGQVSERMTVGGDEVADLVEFSVGG